METHLVDEGRDILPHPIGGGVLQRLYLPLHPVGLVNRVVPEHVCRLEELQRRLGTSGFERESRAVKLVTLKTKIT